MSYGGRYVLINSSLSNTPIYHMSMFMVPKNVLKNGEDEKEIFLAGWKSQKEISYCQMVKSLQSQEERGVGDEETEKIKYQFVLQMVVDP
jgi:hypothetical protein